MSEFRIIALTGVDIWSFMEFGVYFCLSKTVSNEAEFKCSDTFQTTWRNVVLNIDSFQIP